MSTEAPQGAGAVAPSQPQKVVIEVASQQQPQGIDFQRMTPDQFNGRLQEAEEAGIRRFLKSFGVKKEDRAEVLAQIQAGKYRLAPTPADGEPDYRAEYEKLKPISEKYSALETELKSAHEILKSDFNAKLEKLPEAVKKFVTAASADDWRAQQKALANLESSGMLAAIAGQAAAAEPAKPNPATTMAPAGPNTPTTAAKTAFQQYEEIVKSGNRILAAQYRSQNANAIEATRPK